MEKAIAAKLTKLDFPGFRYILEFILENKASNLDHWYRFIKQRLHWTLAKLSTPQQCDRCDLMPLMTWEL
ncbi:MAG: hypothetical protein ACYT04_80765, partial [Nostoc sp.]